MFDKQRVFVYIGSDGDDHELECLWCYDTFLFNPNLNINTLVDDKTVYIICPNCQVREIY